MVFEPLGLVVACGVEVEVLCVFPLFHLLSMDSLGICYLLFQVGMRRAVQLLDIDPHRHGCVALAGILVKNATQRALE